MPTFYNPAVVLEGSIPYTDNAAQYSQNAVGVWLDCMVNNRYEHDNRTYMMGVASPSGFGGQSTAFVKLASTTLLWVSDWTVATLGRKPKIPPPQSANSNWVLLDHWEEPCMITVAADGVSPLYRISGTYFYGCKNPATAQISHGRPPWLSDSFDRSVDQNEFETGIIDSSAPNRDPFLGSFISPNAGTPVRTPAAPGVP